MSKKMSLTPGCIVSATDGTRVRYFMYLGQKTNACYPTVEGCSKHRMYLPLNFKKFDETVTEDKVITKIKSFLETGKKNFDWRLPKRFDLDKVVMEETAKLQHQVAIVRTVLDENV